MTLASARPAAALLVLVLSACAALGRVGMVGELKGTVALDRKPVPAVVYLDDPKRGRWRLEGPAAEDLTELDRALVEVRGLGRPRDPVRPSEPGRFDVRAYRLVEVGGRPALVGMLAWEGSDLVLVEIDREDRRVPLRGAMLPRLPSLMGNTIWVAGAPRQGGFVVERYGVLRR